MRYPFAFTKNCRFFLVNFLIAFVLNALDCECAFSFGNQALYEDSFDLGAGGATLTRASQDAVMFANPAIMPFGRKIFRWVGSTYNLMVGKDSIEEAKSLGVSGGSASSSSTTDYVDKVFSTPLHFGVSSVTSLILNRFAFGVFARFEPDIAGQEFDATGLPLVRARADFVSGSVVSLAHNLTPWFSLGVTGKYLLKSAPDISVSLDDQEKIDALKSDPNALKNSSEPGTGTGFDAGALFFRQGSSVDWRLGLKVDNVGDTKFTKSQDPLPQMYHAGLGMTIHNTIDSLNLGIDFRDISNAYQTTTPLKVYAGAKLIIRNYIGFAAGLYQGYPSFGVRIDLLLIKVGLTYYEKEMGRFAGDDGREIYVATVALGV